MNKRPATQLLIILNCSWLSVCACAQPYASTLGAGPITTNSATLNGMATPRGSSTVAWFEWGTDASYGQVTSPVDVGSGTNVFRVSATIGDLLPNSTFRCRLVASNSAGMAFGRECRFTTGRRVASWGDSLFGPIGSVLPPANLGNAIAVAAGDYHGLAVKPDGTVVTWGRYYSYDNQLGFYHYPVTSAPASLTNVVAVSGGRGHSLALRSTGRVVGWGDNSSGQTNVPANLSNVVAIAAGDTFSMALRSDGAFTNWGSLIIPPVPPLPRNVIAIAAGDTHCLVLRNNGTVAAFGNNTYSQSSVPAGLTNVIAIAAGYQHSLALKADGSVVGWGLGAGANVPANLSNVVQIAAGDYHSLALKSDGTLTSWGSSLSPTSITPPTGINDVVHIACGDEYCVALASNTPPQATPQTSTGAVNSDLVVSLSPRMTRDPNSDPLTWRIVSLPASGSLFQYASGMRGGEITETNTPVSDTSGNVIFAPGPDEFGAPYATFNVVANDGEFDSAPSLATVNIVPAPLVTIAGPTQNYQGVIMSFAGLSNASYTVYRSTDLTNWSAIQSASQPLPGQFNFTDFSVTNQPRRFYRIRSP